MPGLRDVFTSGGLAEGNGRGDSSGMTTGYCLNCKWWGAVRFGIREEPQTYTDGRRCGIQHPKWEIIENVFHGTVEGLMTLPDFGCVQFKATDAA